MKPDFKLFGLSHLAILGAIPLMAWALARIGRRSAAAARALRLTLGSFLLANELVWYGYRLHTEGWRFPEGLPLQLCDLGLWMTILAAFTLHPLAVETAYFVGVGGGAQAVLTPDLWAPVCSYPTVYFFVAHGGFITAILAVLGSGAARLRPGSMWRAFGVANAWMVLVAGFNWFYGTNYMYLCRKPASASLLDRLGSWPWYILAGELMAVAVFALLWLPFARRR